MGVNNTHYRLVARDRHDTERSMEAVTEVANFTPDALEDLKTRLYAEFNCEGSSCDDAFNLAVDLAGAEGEEAVRESFMRLASLFLPH